MKIASDGMALARIWSIARLTKRLTKRAAPLITLSKLRSIWRIAQYLVNRAPHLQ